MNNTNDFVRLKQMLQESSTEITPNTTNRYLLIKRTIDIMCSLAGAIIGFPFLLVFGILVYLESPGQVIFVQKRVGKDGEIFKLYKLRSMCLDAEKEGQKWAEKNDKRILKVGKIIRKLRIDEIPQVYNILKGDMSIVGPRPEVLKLTCDFNEIHPGFIDRLKVRPGLTGLAQVSGGYDMKPGEKLEKDIDYIKNQKTSLDLWIILKTVWVVVSGNGAR
ncbi:MAG: sugar transferase [Turicibacter sp.]